MIAGVSLTAERSGVARTAAGPLTCGTCATTPASRSPVPASVRTWPPENDVPHAMTRSGSTPVSDRVKASADRQSSS